jgi:hypothetical protein
MVYTSMMLNCVVVEVIVIGCGCVRQTGVFTGETVGVPVALIVAVAPAGQPEA